MNTSDDTDSTGRVAVIAIHGVADQRLGDTARTLAELLIAQPQPDVSYTPGMCDDLILQVPPLPPVKKRDNTVSGVCDKVRKSVKQSLGSDFVRSGHTSLNGKRALAATESGLPTPGADFSDYLLAKAQQNEMPTDTYDVPRVRLTRRQPGAPEKAVDIYEMYWADLSRLSGKVPRILSELFTLLFHLSTLGRDTIQAAAAEFHGDKTWQWLSRLQTGLDWAYSRLLALLFLQLIMLALFFVPLGILSDHVGILHKILSAVLGVGTLLGIAYFKRRFVLGLAAGIAVGAAAYFCKDAGPWLVGFVWLAFLSYCYDIWLKACAERFRFVRAVGWILWGALLAVLVVVAFLHKSPDLLMWITAALRGVEYVLWAMSAWWIGVGVLLPVWLLLGWAAGRRGFHARASVATGRLALVVSLGFFLVLAMSGWALVNNGLKYAVGSVSYSPVIFGAPVTALCPDSSSACFFLQDRFASSTDMFAPVAFLLLCLVAYLIVAFVPSVLSELKIFNDKCERLGCWLTGGYRRLDQVIAGVVLFGAAAAFLVSMILLAARFFPYTHGLQVLVDINWVAAKFAKYSESLLKPLVYTAASATLVFSGVGGLLSRYVPSLRAPLDAALDVDNHFREFPRRAIPRAQIFSRYVALLDYVSRQGYERIVVVSHSQGTVITAELLRYLKERAALQLADDAAGMVWHRIHSKLRLLTAGCPLRQLYAARFPVIYDWILKPVSPTMGPTAHDVGVNVWVNIYATGDYVGRWLWSRPPAQDHSDISCPQIDADHAGRDKYAANLTVPASLPLPATTQDVSLGAGAHTHYFDKDNGAVAPKVASVIDALIV